MITMLGQIAAEFYLVPLATHRSTDLSELMATIDFGPTPVRRCGSLRGALHLVKREARHYHDPIIVIVGSHYLVGEYLKRIDGHG
jgi:folylpolyglutamate synthase/dihydropteroate synthase